MEISLSASRQTVELQLVLISAADYTSPVEDVAKADVQFLLKYGASPEVVPPEDFTWTNLGDGWYFVELAYSFLTPGPVSIDVSAPGTLHWRDIHRVVAAPEGPQEPGTGGSSSSGEGTGVPDSGSEPTRGTNVLTGSWIAHDGTRQIAADGEGWYTIAPGARVQLYQIFQYLALGATYGVELQFEGPDNEPVPLDILKHTDPFTTILKEPDWVIDGGLHKSSFVPTQTWMSIDKLRLRVWVDNRANDLEVRIRPVDAWIGEYINA